MLDSAKEETTPLITKHSIVISYKEGKELATTFIKKPSTCIVMDDYETLLKKAREKLPTFAVEKSRFEVPNARGHIQGTKTIITNFQQIVESMQRDPQHVLKYILKGLAIPGEVKSVGMVLGGKIPASRINEKIQQYAQEFVFCRECHKPETKLEKEGMIYFMKCQACGARHSIKSR